MCQLLALNCNTPSAVTFSFTGFAARGGLTGDHADGFGLAFHQGNACRLFIDEGAASSSALAHFLRDNPIRAQTVLGHIRKATQGPIHLSNSHPFLREWQGKHWTFCHNGDLKNYSPRLTGHFKPVGQTDSEHAFCWMMQELRRRLGRHRAPSWRQTAAVLSELAEDISRFGAFNFLLTNGEVLFAHASTRLFWTSRSHPFATAQLVDQDVSMDLSVPNGVDDRMVLVATEPLTRNETWIPFAPGELRVFRAGLSVQSSVAIPDLIPSA